MVGGHRHYGKIRDSGAILLFIFFTKERIRLNLNIIVISFKIVEN
jgi:hypothetical protein